MSNLSLILLILVGIFFISDIIVFTSWNLIWIFIVFSVSLLLGFNLSSIFLNMWNTDLQLCLCSCLPTFFFFPFYMCFNLLISCSLFPCFFQCLVILLGARACEIYLFSAGCLSNPLNVLKLFCVAVKLIWNRLTLLRLTLSSVCGTVAAFSSVPTWPYFWANNLMLTLLDIW